MHLILGSTSPRRREILSYFTLNFEQMSPDFNEETIPFQGEPQNFVQTLAKEKALSLSRLYPDAAILTADTIVYKEGKIYGKPKNEQEAYQFLLEFQDAWHSVFSGVALFYKKKIFSKFSETKVLFHPLSQKQIEHYLKLKHWADKAGGYAIQNEGSLIVKKIEGCYYNVMGFPIQTVNQLLNRIGVDLWDHLR